MMDALWEQKLAMDEIAAMRVQIAISAVLGNDELVEIARESVKVCIKSTPLDTGPCVTYECVIGPAQVKTLVEKSSRWKAWGTRKPKSHEYMTYSLSRAMLETNRRMLERGDPYPLSSEDELLRVLEFLPLIYRNRLLQVNRGWHVAALKAEFAAWHDSWNQRVRDGENGHSTNRRGSMLVNPLMSDDDVVQSIALKLELADPPPRNEVYRHVFMRGMIRADIVDERFRRRESAPLVWNRPPGYQPPNQRRSRRAPAGSPSGTLPSQNPDSPSYGVTYQGVPASAVAALPTRNMRQSHPPRRRGSMSLLFGSGRPRIGRRFSFASMFGGKKNEGTKGP